MHKQFKPYESLQVFVYTFRGRDTKITTEQLFTSLGSLRLPTPLVFASIQQSNINDKGFHFNSNISTLSVNLLFE